MKNSSSSSVKLLNLASDPLGAEFGGNIEVGSRRSRRQLEAFLSEKNGCLVFESALYILPVDEPNQLVDLRRINADDAHWRKKYIDIDTNFYVFAADIFGGLFAIKDEIIIYFEPETGEVIRKCDDFAEWCDLILRHYKIETGWRLANEWQKLNGPLNIGIRLVPKLLFVLGGRFHVNNLYEMSLLDSLCLRGEFASQLLGVPDGEKVNIKTIR